MSTDPGRAVDASALGDHLARLADDRRRVTDRDLVEAVADAAPHGLDGPGIVRVAAALGATVGTGEGVGRSDVGWSPTAVARAVADGTVVDERVPGARRTRASTLDVAPRRNRSVVDGFGDPGRAPPGRGR